MEREMKQVWFSKPTNPPWEQMDDDNYDDVATSKQKTAVPVAEPTVEQSVTTEQLATAKIEKMIERTTELKIKIDKIDTGNDSSSPSSSTSSNNSNSSTSPSIERKLNELRSPRIRGVESRSRILVAEKRRPSPPPVLSVPTTTPAPEQKQQTPTNAIAAADVPQMITTAAITTAANTNASAAAAAATKGKNDFDNRVDSFADSIGQCATDCGKCKFCRASADKCHCVIL